MALENSSSGEAEAVVLVKAAPQVGDRHGETVCCAVIDIHGNWLRLYPVSCRQLDEGQKFGRWDRIKFRWRMSNNDPRIESRRVDQDSPQISGEIKPKERQGFLARSIVTSLNKEREAGRSLALLKPLEVLEFWHEPKSAEDIAAQRAKFTALHAQHDCFSPTTDNASSLKNLRP